MKNALPAHKRVIIKNVSPQVDGGLFPVKTIEDSIVHIQADIFADGHDKLSANILYRHKKQKHWKQEPLVELGNDAWKGKIHCGKKGYYQFKIVAWVDEGLTFLHDVERKIKDGQNVSVELLMGAQLLMPVIKKSRRPDKITAQDIAEIFADKTKYDIAIQIISGKEIKKLFEKYPDRKNETVYEKTLEILCERKKAGYSAWYEFFPRSASLSAYKHGTFEDAEKIIPYIHALGFDVIYLPPIHPIGEAFRKGKNNSTDTKQGDPGSPWAIGNKYGGHKELHPDLGTQEHFKHFMKIAKQYDIDIALDYALQCSPDHPYVKQHPQWFKWKPDGTVQYAENPPKKYQDVLPLNFETKDWKNLWNELKSILEYWIKQGVTIFRVDNPHTKPFIFWEWIIAEIKKKHPDIIFLSEAFTRPKIMYQLAKIGFTQSYTYFTWRNNKAELIDYMNELTRTDVRYFFRPNFWPNTPDILPYNLQGANEAAFCIRFVLAATLSSNYGIYGPAYELCENVPVPEKEEYFNSEKYEIKKWDWQTGTPLRNIILKVNSIRKEHTALHNTYNIHMLETTDDNIIAYLKYSDAKDDIILVAVNMDSEKAHSAWVKVPIQFVNIQMGNEYAVHDLITNAIHKWQDEWNYIMLNPQIMPFHIFHVIYRS